MLHQNYPAGTVDIPLKPENGEKNSVTNQLISGCRKI
jgi:hypothetical protein